MKSNPFVALACAALLGELPSSCAHRPPVAFVGRLLSLKASRPSGNALPAAKDGDRALFDAEQAAAVDAHDVSDAGVEGAAMERAVMMAADLEGEMHDQIHKERVESEQRLREAEADFARGLSDIAALEHADQVLSEMKAVDRELMDAEEAAAVDAHDVSDAGVEGAAMERAVIMAADLEDELHEKIHQEREASQQKKTFFGKIRSLFRRTDDEEEVESEDDLIEARKAEANFAKGLSNVAALEHASEISIEESEVTEEERDEDLILASRTEAKYALDLSDAAALEHAETSEYDETTISREKVDVPTVEEHYKSIERDIKTIEHLINEADHFDRSEGHSLERTFSDDDAADLALMMLEKSIVAATDKLELSQMKAEQTESKVKAALEEKYEAKALAESIERDRRAAEMRFLSTEHFNEDVEVLERRRDSSILHADNELLADALKREHGAELKLEKAIEEDIAAKKELEQLIDNKAVLKQEFHDLEKIIHERTLAMWEKENAKKDEKPEETEKAWHHFDWWHKRW